MGDRQVRIVLGGSKGLGRAITEILLDQGNEVIVLSRSIDQELSHRDNLQFIEIDLTDIREIRFAADELLDGWDLARVNQLYLCAGKGYPGDFSRQSEGSILAIYRTILVGPTIFLRFLVNELAAPIHLVTIASTTSSKVRLNETVYGAAKAGQAQFARGFHQELVKIQPGSKSTLVHPGGMNTDFYEGTGIDASEYMDPKLVAAVIVSEVTNQIPGWSEFSIPRSKQPVAVHGTPQVTFP